MKHRKTHLGLSLKVISILSCVAILAVGFANWWIIQKPDATVSEGSFDVYAVSNKYINITATNKNNDSTDNWLSNDKIVFGKSNTKKAGGTVAPSWLIATNVGDAVLSTTLSFTLTLSDTASSASATSENAYLDDMISTVTITLTPAAATSEQISLASAVSGNYLATPSVSAKYGASSDSVSSSLTNTASTVYNTSTGAITMTFAVPADVKQIFVNVVFSFDWGTKFGGENPFVYYNQMDYSPSNATTASTDLGTLAKLTETKYEIKISTALKAN